MVSAANLTADQMIPYHAEHFANGAGEYYSQGSVVKGQWFGKLAERFGLSGDAADEHYHRLARGYHPITNELLVRPVKGTPYIDPLTGKEVTPQEHRGGTDFTFSAPKEFSAALYVGGGTRLQGVHDRAVITALTAAETFVQARTTRFGETTGNMVAVLFAHNSARPVEGYSSPQCHTHGVMMNMTEDSHGRIRSVQNHELMAAQSYMKAIYRNELAHGLTALGYEWTVGEHNEPKILGFTPEYITQLSQRSELIKAQLEKSGRTGARAAAIASLETREAKIHVSHEIAQEQHQHVAEMFGNQPQAVVAAARQRGDRQSPDSPAVARKVVSYARNQQLERTAIFREMDIRRVALVRGMGRVKTATSNREVDRRIERRSFLQRPAPEGRADRSFTTPSMVRLEQRVIDLMTASMGQEPQALSEFNASKLLRETDSLNDDQRGAVLAIASSRDRVMAIDGVAGGGKTTVLEPIQRALAADGYRVIGLAPTTSAAASLSSAVPGAHTVQHHLVSPPTVHEGQKRFFIVDEASLASTMQMHRLLKTLAPGDRMLLVGDTRQHESVEAGRVFAQLQEHGLATAHIRTIVRQQDPQYLAAVQDLSQGLVASAFQKFQDHGCVFEIPDRSSRLEAAAKDVLQDPSRILAVVPDHDSRLLLNDAIHRGLRERGDLTGRDVSVPTLAIRQDMTKQDRAWAGMYQVNDWLRFNRSVPTLGIAKGALARVTAIDEARNRLTVDVGGRTVDYNPKRNNGVGVFRTQVLQFAIGDRITFTQPHSQHNSNQKIPNRTLGTVRAIGGGAIRIQLDDPKKGAGKGRSVGFQLRDFSFLAHGYTTTSYSSQSKSVAQHIFVADTDRGGSNMNWRTAYVALSRSRDAVRIYTNDVNRLIRDLSRDKSQRSAIELPTSHAYHTPERMQRRR